MKNVSIRAALALIAVLGAASALGASVASAQEKGGDGEAKAGATQRASDESVVAAQLPFYPLTTCVVSGEKLDEDAVNVVVDGNLYRLCCDRCPAKVKADTAKYRAKVERAVVSAQKPLWPMDVCPVSGEPLTGPDAEPVDFVHGMRYVKLCCGGCKRKVAKNSARVFQQVDAALKDQQRATYPLDTCVISGEKLGSMGEPVERLYGMTLVRFCCKRCVGTFEKDPAKYAKQVRDARIDARRGKGEGKGDSKTEKAGGDRRKG